MSTFENILIFIKKYILYFIIAWIILLIIMRLVLSRTNHNELFTWFNNQQDVQKEYACISPWRISSAIEFPSAISSIYSKPFQNKATPYFLDSLARRYGNPMDMPPPHIPSMTIDDWCIGLGMRLYNWASSLTNNFSLSENATTNIVLPNNQTILIRIWIQTNMALSLDGGITVLDSYQVYKKYGSPMAWQFPQWQGWLACRIRPPGYPSWNNTNSPSNAENYPNINGYTPTSDDYDPNGTFEWGSSFVQTGYLPPYGCLGSKCQDTNPTCPTGPTTPQPNQCGFISTDSSKSSCSVSGTCQNNPSGLYQGAIQKHELLPYTDPIYDSYGDVFSSQYAANNPFIAYEIPASSPIILRFLGYGFDQPDTTKTSGGTNNTNVFTGGPASDQYTQIEQFITLVNNGGFYGYAETNSNMSQSQLENYLFGFYTFEEKGIPNPTKPNSNNNCSTGSIAGETISGSIGGLGAGAMIGTMVAGPAAPIIVGAGLIAGGLGGYLSSKGKCDGGSGACLIM